MVTLGLETVLIGDPGEGELLAFGRNPVRGSLVGVTHAGFVVLAVSAAAVVADLLLGVGFIAGGVVRSSVAKTIIILYNKFLLKIQIIIFEITSSGHCRPSCGHQTR